MSHLFTCVRPGHYTPECGAKSSSKNTVICQLCKKPGHEADTCRKFLGATTVPGKASIIKGDFNSLRLPNDSEFSVSETPWKQQHIYSGFLCENDMYKPVTVLRDTGSAVHAIHEKFVSQDQYINETQSLVVKKSTLIWQRYVLIHHF